MVFRRRLVAAAVATALVVAAIGVASTTIAAADRSGVACGDAITADTRLAADLVNCPGGGLVVAADGITLDLGGHRIDGDGSGDDVGIDVSGHHDVTIAHGTVRDFTEGVLVADSTQVALRGLTSADQAHGGITVDGSSAVTIAGNVVRHAGAGIIVSHAAGVLVSANRVSGSAFGAIATYDSQRVAIADNTVTSAGDAAIGLFDGSARNEVTGNRLSRSGAGVGLNDGASENVVAGNGDRARRQRRHRRRRHARQPRAGQLGHR
jgi:parallel beta-helix repeat protein